MKKYIAICTIVICGLSLYAQTNSELIFYIPSETELQYFMNLYAKLKSIEDNASSINQLEDLYYSFESEKYYETYQRILFESYLLSTHNQSVKNVMLNFFEQEKIHTEFTETLKRLYTSKYE